MPKIFITPLKIHRYFPPNDELAVKIARMCVLVEDFILESKGYITEEEIAGLDNNSTEFRRIYFLRNAFGTAFELKSAIECIRQNTDFKKFIEVEDPELLDQYNDLYANFNKHHRRLRDIRNEIGGGHVHDSAIKKGLEIIDPFAEGLLQTGEGVKDAHFKFTSLIANRSLTAMISNSPDSSRDAFYEQFEELGEAVMSGRSVAYLIFLFYLKGKGFLPIR